jgi:hypothetical protein
MRIKILAAAACAVCLQISAQVDIYETGTWPDIRVAAQETNGTIHAAGVGDAWRAWNWNENWQPSYNNSPWNAWGSSDTGGAVPVSMDTAGDGSVISLWENKTDGSVLALLQSGNYGGTARLAGIRGPAERVRVLMDSQANLWVTEAGVNICQATSRQNYHRQTPPLVHAITLGELWPGGNATNRLPVSMAEDARGRIWFWSNCLLGDDSRGAIRGVLIHENGGVTNCATLAGVPAGRISVIAPLDGTNLWLAVRDAGIFSVNPDTLAGTRVEAPEKNAFLVVQQIFSVGEDRYVISGAPWEFNSHGLRSALWRWRDGQWKKLVDGLDIYGSSEQLADRRWLVTKEGLWLGAFGLGGWFVPLDDGPAQVINWQKNSPLDTIHRWFQLKDGRMLGLQFGRGGIIADAALLAQKPAMPPTARIVPMTFFLPTTSPLVRTTDGKVFAVLCGDEAALNEWDGQQWQRHPFPDKVQPWGSCKITGDSQGRIWLMDALYNPDPALVATYVFDPGKNRFQKFSNLRGAIQAQLAATPDFRIGNGEPGFPEFSRDGRICYDSNDRWQVNYFDGHQWRAWHKNTGIMTGEYLHSGPDHSPFFAPNGKLSIVLNEHVWQFDDLTGWKKTDLKPDTARPPVAPKENSVAPPYAPTADSIVADDHGIYWVVAGRQLFRTGHGLHVAVFAPNEPQPFADGRKLISVLTDKFGSTFLRTSVQGRDEYVLVPARGPLPQTTAKLLENGDDGVTLQLTANIPSPRFSWRVDDALWSNADTNQTLHLEELSAGKHRVQVIALDAQLQTDPVPVEIAFGSHAVPGQQIQKWIAQLGDKDFSRREAAVKNLSRQAALALPALRQARERETDPDRRWWLDAAIQQCE